ncbi:MAG: hypothetical protein IJK28_00655 [Clostridia bacterium]|nr:hypothetical protein [Clostridia bacterium]
MAKKDRGQERETPKAAAEYYRLKTDAVDALVGANEQNSPPVSEKELRKYRKTRGLRLGAGLKAFLIKWWFAGMVCYFFWWGLPLQNVLDQMAVVGIVLGLVTDLLVNNIMRYYARPEGENDRWMMFPPRKVISLAFNLVYALFLMVLVYFTYYGLNGSYVTAVGENKGVLLDVGPVFFGLFTAGWDMLLLGARQLILKILDDAKKNAGHRP